MTVIPTFDVAMKNNFSSRNKYQPESFDRRGSHVVGSADSNTLVHHNSSSVPQNLHCHSWMVAATPISYPLVLPPSPWQQEQRDIASRNQSPIHVHERQSWDHRTPAAELDDRSNVSSLLCGSIPVDPNYDPAKDPMNIQFVPPLEIVVRSRQETPEWLQLNQNQDETSIPEPDLTVPVLGRRKQRAMSPAVRQNLPSMRRRQSLPLSPAKRSSRRLSLSSTAVRSAGRNSSKVEMKENCSSVFMPNESTVVGTSIESGARTHSSLQTSPTELSSEGENSPRQTPLTAVRRRRRSVVRTELNHYMGKRLPMFHRRESVDLQRSSHGCLT